MAKIESVGARVRDVTPSDTAEVSRLGGYPRALYVKTGGALKFVAADDADANAQTWTVVAGQWIPIAVRKVWSTGTTATVSAVYE